VLIHRAGVGLLDGMRSSLGWNESHLGIEKPLALQPQSHEVQLGEDSMGVSSCGLPLDADSRWEVEHNAWTDARR